MITSRVSLEEGNTILVCPSSYVALRMSDNVLQVVEIVQCIENKHDGYHVVFCGSFLKHGDVERLSYNVPTAIYDGGGNGHKCLRHERFYTTNSILLLFSCVQGMFKFDDHFRVCVKAALITMDF